MIKDLISVIVPCFNVEKWLPDCFKSLDNQIYKNFEVIFINDGSKDATLQMLQDYCDKNNNAYLINQKNAGLSNARNEGVRIAQGEYVYFYDADDILFPNTLQDFHRLITEYNCDCAIANYKRVPADFKFEDLTEEKNTYKMPTIFAGGGF